MGQCYSVSSLNQQDPQVEIALGNFQKTVQDFKMQNPHRLFQYEHYEDLLYNDLSHAVRLVIESGNQDFYKKRILNLATDLVNNFGDVIKKEAFEFIICDNTLEAKEAHCAAFFGDLNYLKSHIKTADDLATCHDKLGNDLLDYAIKGKQHDVIGYLKQINIAKLNYQQQLEIKSVDIGNSEQVPYL